MAPRTHADDPYNGPIPLQRPLIGGPRAIPKAAMIDRYLHQNAASLSLGQNPMGHPELHKIHLRHRCREVTDVGPYAAQNSLMGLHHAAAPSPNHLVGPMIRNLP